MNSKEIKRSIGWVAIYRKIWENKIWFAEVFTKGQAWVDLILLANHEDDGFWCRNIWVPVKRGEVGYSQESLSLRWKWSRGKVDRFLKYLENEQQIRQQKDNVSTVITIVNYDQYQFDEQQNGQQTDTRRTADGHQTDTRRTQTDNDNNGKNVKNDKKEELLARFEKWWLTYPVKEAKKKAGEIFLRLTEVKRLECEDKTPGWLAAHRYALTINKYIPHATTYLNQERWNDDLDTIRAKRRDGGNESQPEREKIIVGGLNLDIKRPMGQ